MRIQKTIATAELLHFHHIGKKWKRLLFSKRFVGEKLCKGLSNFQLKQNKEIIFENQTQYNNNT